MRPNRSTGYRIRKRREALELSQRALAEGLDKVTFAYVSRIESGERTPSLSALIQIAERLETTALYLATGNEDQVCPFCERKP